MAGYTLEIRVGRLIEHRVLELRARETARQLREKLDVLSVGKPGQLIMLADFRPVSVFPPEVADEFKQMMLMMNTRLLRSAILVAPDHATNALQVDRFVRETHNPSRQRFTDVSMLLRWLGEVSTPAEIARAQAFLAEG